MEIEQHPLEPFLPGNARLLMLGSFPPQKKRWSMEFYYPNWNNDMWRITGFLSSMTRIICRQDEEGFLQRTPHQFPAGKGYCLVRHSLCHPAPAGQCLGQVSGSSAAYGHSCPTAPDTAMQGYRHHRREGNGHAVHAVFHRQAQSRRLHGVSFRKPSDAPLPDAFFLRAYPLALEKKAAAYRIMYQDLQML